MRVSFRTSPILISFVYCSFTFLLAQTDPPAGIPHTVTVCDTLLQLKACADWIWNGKDFDYNYGKASGTGTITRNGSSEMILRRTDSQASWPVKRADVEYIGTFDTDHSGHGTSKYVFKGQQPYVGTWTADFAPMKLAERPAAKPPVALSRSAPENASVVTPPGASASSSRLEEGTVSLPTKDPLHAACPDYATPVDMRGSLAVYEQGRKTADIERDGPFGTDLGHTQEALRYYCKASSMGNAVADYEIATIMESGYMISRVDSSGRPAHTSVPPDMAAAVHFFQRSANKGFSRSLYALSMIYAVGPGYGTAGYTKVGVDRDLALRLLQQAGEAGEKRALVLLARAYVGLPVPAWVQSLSIAPNREKARDKAKEVSSIVEANEKECTAIRVRSEMVDLLPDSARNRPVLGASIVDVHGTGPGRPMQIECSLRLGKSSARRRRVCGRPDEPRTGRQLCEYLGFYGDACSGLDGKFPTDRAYGRRCLQKPC